MADYGSSDTSTTVLEIDQFPVSEVYVPNGGLTALEGGPSSQDLGGKKSAPASMYVKDGSDVAQGTTTDAANASTVVGQLKQIQANTNGGATAANQTTANTSLSSVSTNTSNTATNTSNINVATGAKTDSAATDSTSSWSVIALLKGIISKLLTSIAVTQSGTWTVQPGNTANTTAWKVDGSGVTQPIKGDFAEQAALSAGSLNADLVPSTDVSGYTYAMLALTGTWNLSLTIAGSNDNSNFFSTQYTVNGGNAGYFSSSIANNSNNSIVIIPIYYRYLRVRVTGYTSGTVNGALELYTAKAVPFVGGTITANAGTNLNTSLLALETGGNLASAKTDLDTISSVSGATTDAAVVGDNTGSVSAKLRGFSKIWNDVWDGANHWLQVKVMNGNANGQSTMANSSPVVIASDQSAVQIKRSAVAAYSATQTAQGTGNSGDLTVGPYTELSIDINITANVQGTNPTLQFEYDRKGVDGIYYPVWFSDLITGLPANPTKVSVSLGAGMQWPESLGTTGRILWTVGGTATPQYTFSVNAVGK